MRLPGYKNSSAGYISTMRTSSDVHNALQAKGVKHEIYVMEDAPRKARRAAAILGVSEAEVAKTLIAWADDLPILLMIPANRHLDLEKIANLLGAGSVRMADVSEVVELTDYLVGATPPVALVRDMRTVLDKEFLSLPIMYCGGGEPNAILKIRPSDMVGTTGALVAPITSE